MRWKKTGCKSKSWRNERQTGYILLEIVFGIFVFGVGAGVILGTAQMALHSQIQTEHRLQAVNLACSTVEEVMADVKEEGSMQYDSPFKRSDQVGIFQRTIRTERQELDLVRIIVAVTWQERGERKSYDLEAWCCSGSR